MSLRAAFQATLASVPPGYPAPAGGSLAAWYALESAVVSPTNRVIQWRDQSGNEHHSELMTDATAPYWQNGRIVYAGERNNNVIQVIDFPRTRLTLPQPFSVVVRAKINGNAAAPFATDYLFDGYDGSRTLITNNGSGNDDEAFYFGLESGAMFPVVIARDRWKGQWHTYSLVVDGERSAAYLDGALVAAQNLGAGGLNGLRFGARFSSEHGLNGELSEALVYRSALDAAQIGQVHSYLAGRHF